MSKYNRIKGLNFEREVAKLLRPFFPESKRHLEFQVQEANGTDVFAGPFAIQCKRFKGYASVNTIEEVKLCPIESKIPLLITKGNAKKAVVCLYLDDFLRLVKLAYGKRK